MDSRFSNQRSIIDEQLLGRTRFMVVGAGAIGSFYVAMLSKMGGRDITVCDFDRLENHNFSSQFYPVSGLGKAKVDVLKDIALSYGDAEIKAIAEPWCPEILGLGASEGRGQDFRFDIVVSCVDNMGIRSVLWDYYKDKCDLFLDGRMSAQFYKVFGVETSNKEACDYYASTLHSQEVAEIEPCGQKSIIYTVSQVAGMMLSQTKQFLNKEYRPTSVFFDSYNNDIVKTYHMNPPVIEEIVAMETEHEESHPETH